MIKGIGIDAVDINRFADWHTKSIQELEKIFTRQEIDYCLRDIKKSAERFAARFAAKEAFLKALQAAYPEKKISLIALAKMIEVTNNSSGLPSIIYSEHPSLTTHISLTHTHSLAIAYIIIN